MKTVLGASIALLLISGCIHAPITDRKNELARIKTEMAADGIKPDETDQVWIDSVQNDIDTNNSNMGAVDAELDNLEAHHAERLRERQAAEASKAATIKRQEDESAFVAEHGIPLVNLLMIGKMPDNGSIYYLGAMKVLGRAKGGYLVTVNEAYGETGSSNPIFLRTVADYVDGQALRASAIYEGKSFRYVSVTGAERNVLELRHVAVEGSAE